MTSNLGADEFKKFTKPLGFLPEGQKIDDLKKSVMKKIEEVLSPEFLNRIDDIIVFSPLTESEVREITLMYLDRIKHDMASYGKHLVVTDSAVDSLVKLGYSEKYGARFLKRVIDDKVKIPITLKWKDAELFKVDAVDGDIRVECGVTTGSV